MNSQPPLKRAETRGRPRLPAELKRMTASFCLDRRLYEKIQEEATRLNCSKSKVISDKLCVAFDLHP